jgi:serine-type D-Ala-D-Ala carboxypeptidase (penicillin-binding protein 5/6)
VDIDTGRILFAKAIHTQHAMASTTKIMTALTFLHLFPTSAALQAETTVVEEDLVGEANMNLRKGERIKLSTLLLGLLTNSANEAGMTLARYAGQFLSGPPDPVDRFVAAMNTYALTLGMYESHYMNPHGLDQAGHYTTAYDLAISGWYALRNPILMQNAQFVSGTVEGHDFYNQNSFLTRYPGATGLKPGWTDDAGHCLVATARRNGHNVMVVVLNSPWLATDVDPLMDYAFTLLDGKAEQSVNSLNLGWLEIPRAGIAASGGSSLTPQILQAAVRQQLEFSLQLAAAQVKE